MRRVLLIAVLAALFVAPVARAWTWPVGGPVLQPFSFDAAHPYAAGEHRGIDIGATAAEVVLAPEPGTVTFSGTVPGSGRALTITTADGLAVTLTHLGAIEVAAGAVVAEGQRVGSVGPSGDPEVAGPYVHLGIRVASEAQGYRDPATFLPARGAAPAAPPAAPVAARAGAGPGRRACDAECAAGDAGRCSVPGAGCAGDRPEPGGGHARPGRLGRGCRRSAAAVVSTRADRAPSGVEARSVRSRTRAAGRAPSAPCRRDPWGGGTGCRRDGAGGPAAGDNDGAELGSVALARGERHGCRSTRCSGGRSPQ